MRTFLLCLMAICLAGAMPAQRTKLHYPPTRYWMQAIDDPDANYERAVRSFEDFWHGQEIPRESLEPLLGGKRKRRAGRRGIPTTPYPIEDLRFQARRFERWAWMNQRRVGPDGSLAPWPGKATQDGSPTSDRRGEITADWTPLGPNSAIMDQLLQESRIGRMVQVKFHPHDPARMYAVSGSGGLFITDDQGYTWRSTGTDAFPFGFQPASVCIDPTDDRVLYLGMGDPNFGGQAHGVFKSTDGGQTWTDISGAIGDRLVYAIHMSPIDHNVLIAAADGGIWRSVDAGAHWDRRLALTFDDIQDIIPRPGAVDTLYACSFSRFFRSTDGGESWSEPASGIEVPAGGGRGMRLAVSPADPDIVYLGMIARHGTVFRSDDGGQTFEKVYQDTVGQSLVTYTGLVGGESNGNYNFAMTADPDDAEIVYFGTQTLWKSTDGGRHWTSLYAYGARVHPDIHDLEFSPLDHSLFSINDGGIAVSPDGGVSWFQRNDGIVAGEVYNGGQSPLRPDIVYIGTQDNGGIAFYDGRWRPLERGDVYDAFWFDYHTPERVYSTEGYSRNLLTQQPYPMAFPLTAPGSRRYAFTPADTAVAFLCQNEIWRCMNINSRNPVWRQISTPLSSGSSDYIRDLAIAPTNADEAYAVLPNSTILYTDNARADVPVYDTLTAPSPSSFHQTCLVLSRQDPGLVYYSSWDRIFRSGDKGRHWTDITDNLPAANIGKVIVDDYASGGAVYVLCGNSVYYRDDSLGMWVEYAQGLPRLAYIGDLMCFNDGSAHSRLRVVTYGRGIFETPMHKPEPLPWCDFTVDTAVTCTGRPVTFNNRSEDGTAWHWDFEGGTPSSYDGQHPPVVFYAKPGRYSVTLAVSNPTGEVVQTRADMIEILSQLPLPYEEGFEGSFPPPGMTLTSLTPSNIRWTQASIGGYAQSAHCAVFNDSYNEAGAEMRINANLGLHHSAILTFDLAYAKLIGNARFDTLEVFASVDCGEVWQSIYKRGGNALATMPDITGALQFDPGASGWRTEQVDLTPFGGQSNVLIALRARGGHGEIIAVDNLAIGYTVTTTGPRRPSDGLLRMAPNPAQDVVTLSLREAPEQPVRLLITAPDGKPVYRRDLLPADEAVTISLAGWPAGNYIINLVSDRGAWSEVLVVR